MALMGTALGSEVSLVEIAGFWFSSAEGGCFGALLWDSTRCGEQRWHHKCGASSSNLFAELAWIAAGWTAVAALTCSFECCDEDSLVSELIPSFRTAV